MVASRLQPEHFNAATYNANVNVYEEVLDNGLRV
jgi:hypothetical protein